ncbi:YidC/Oxa1 family membrane protein insertase [Marchantia polymorpha subsp. ruderalis]|uniref:Membrane insertase YidC/Oxa/ALB C-terminal domain-containing protein n=1 Tax=Marchantia polymorpha TaxID=3197 RepID=A0A2R6XGY4_MARPO|nr:hypothetical protein MARPO_0015s0158 [Marchantia polymorpha]BBN01603.1 hypothetical protein Mp_2g08730 [Marchantia polymorpha subsp. ruderalis]|eukprot:PTQ45370.1 hypothetical protein MARPO_0015s0158 [Marchantia polymorpha]
MSASSVALQCRLDLLVCGSVGGRDAGAVASRLDGLKSSRAFRRRALILKAGPQIYGQPWSPLRRANFSARAHLGHIPGADDIHAHLAVLTQSSEVAQAMLTKAEGAFFMLADAAVNSDAASTTEVVGRQSGGWLGGVTDSLEFFLKILKNGLESVHVPYSYGFAIILLTILVKAATLPLTKAQVESTINMQNLQPKLKAIQTRYQGDQERIQLETARLYKQAGVNPLAGCLPTLATLPVWIGLYRALSNVANEGLLTEGFFWIPSLAGPTTIVARAAGSGISWLFPFENGAPPLGWGDTAAYLVLPVLLVISQFVSMQIMQPPQSTDPSQKNTQLILKFLPLMIGYFSLSVPSGLSLYWLTNNILSTAQQVWLRKPKTNALDTNATIISAGQAKRSTPAAPPAATSLPESSAATTTAKEDRRGEKFRELKMQEARRKGKKGESTVTKAQSVETNGSAAADDSSDDEDQEEGVIDVSAGKDAVEVGGKRSKRSKRRRSD